MASATRRDLIGLLILVAATLLTYLPAMNNGFVWDDDLWLTENYSVHSPGDLGAIWQLDYNSETGELLSPTTQYYPLVFSSFWLENRIWGLAPAGYHIVNIVLHILNALLIWLIVRRLGFPGAWLVAAIFALHPVHVESVAWITQRRNLLSGLFYLLAVWSYLGFEAKRIWWRYGLAFGLLLGALLSKTVTATLPFALLFLVVYLRWQRSRSPWLRWKDLWPLLPMLLAGIISGVVTANLEQGAAGAKTLTMDTSLVERLFILVPSTFAFYAGKIIWPFPVVFVYPRWLVDAGNPLQYLPLLGVLCAMAGSAVAWHRWGKAGPSLLLLFSGVTLAPALGLFNVYFFRYSYVADHWQYLGSLGFIILLTGLVGFIGRRYLSTERFKIFSLIFSVLVLTTLGVSSYRQALAYRDAETLWRDTLEKNPTAWIALNNLGRIEAQQALATQDAKQRQELLRESKVHFEQAMEFPEARPEACNNLANIAFLQKDYRMASRLYKEAIGLQPTDPGPYSNLRQAMTASGQVAQAAEFFERILSGGSVQESLTRAEILHQLARAQADQGLFEKAVASADLAVQTYPSLPNIQVFRAMILLPLQRYQEAIRQLQTVPDENGEYIAARVSLARLLATCPDPALRDCRGARAVVREVVALFEGRRLPPALVELGDIVEAECGR